MAHEKKACEEEAHRILDCCLTGYNGKKDTS